MNVRTGAGLDKTAFTQLPNGTTVEVVGTDGDWIKILLPERIGYVHSDYMTVSEKEVAATGEGGFPSPLTRRKLLLCWNCSMAAGPAPPCPRTGTCH
ncbi:SH3 domain-containing protein [Enterococcus faecium]